MWKLLMAFISYKSFNVNYSFYWWAVDTDSERGKVNFQEKLQQCPTVKQHYQQPSCFSTSFSYLFRSFDFIYSPMAHQHIGSDINFKSPYPVLETISLRILTASSLLMFSKLTSFTWLTDKTNNVISLHFLTIHSVLLTKILFWSSEENLDAFVHLYCARINLCCSFRRSHGCKS